MLILEQLAELLDMISPTLVHGDITLKNLIFDGERFQLIDWEPCLFQIRDGREMLLYTEPYISREDRRRGELSFQTDKLGFFFLCIRLFGRRRPFEEPRRVIFERQHSDVEITPVPESELFNLSFSELCRFAQRRKEWSVHFCMSAAGTLMEKSEVR